MEELMVRDDKHNIDTDQQYGFHLVAITGANGNG